MIALSSGLPELLRLLGDATRLRTLALLEREELSVGELARCLSLAQSRVSNHLRLLREAGLLSERHSGASTYVRLRLAEDAENVSARMWGSLRGELVHLPEHAADLARLERVLAERSAPAGDFFDRLAPEWDKLAGAFSTGQGRERAALHLLPRGTCYADLGCGTGYMAGSLLGHCARLVCIDRSRTMLAEAHKRMAPAARGTRLAFVQAELHALPLPAAALDGLLAGMVIHHLERPETALAEMRRVLKPGAAVAILELAPHRESWMRTELGDRHLGLAPSDVLAQLAAAGFENLSLDPVDDRYCPRPRTQDSGPSASPAQLELYIAHGRAA